LLKSGAPSHSRAEHRGRVAMDPAFLKDMLAATARKGQVASMPPDFETLMQLVQSLPPDAVANLMQEAACSGSTEQAPKATPADVRLSAGGGEDSAGGWNAVLERYCHRGLVREYGALAPDARSSLLKALQVVGEETLRQSMTSRLMAGDKGRSVRADSDCPLVKVLSRNVKTELCQEDVELLKRQVLPSWGVPKPRHIELFRHNMGVEHARKTTCSDGHFNMTSMTTNTTVAKPTERSGTRRDWSALAPVGAADLPLFAVATGRVLQGRLIVDPIVMIGVTTILEDDRGNIVQLGLYNALPGGATGQTAFEVASKTFPNGARIRIAEPYLKIFRDGNRGVRVDDPADLRVELDRQLEVQRDLASAKEEGNKLFGKRQFHAAAAEYRRALRECAQDVAVLLSNRAQALLKEERWAPALQDAAAAALLNPGSGKSWQRYEAAAAGLGFPEVAKRSHVVRGGGVDAAPVPSLTMARAAMRFLLLDLLKFPTAVGGGDGQPQDLKDRGNRAYGGGRYSEAQRLYSMALSALGVAEDAAIVLSNLAQSSLQIGALHDAVAAAAASLRLRSSGKAVHRLARAVALLGECELADELLGLALSGPEEQIRSGSTSALALSREEVQKAMAPRSRDAREFYMVACSGALGTIILDWCASDALEVVDMGTKGRGIRATRSIGQHELLMVQRPRSGCSENVMDVVTSLNSDTRLYDDGSKARLKAHLTSAVCTDMLLASTVDSLYDGRDSKLATVPLEAMNDVMSARVLPLLGQHPDFFPASERLELTSAQVSGVVDINCHGSGNAENSSMLQQLLGQEGSQVTRATCLFPAISLLNHAKTPTCVLLPLIRGGQQVALMVASARSVPAGEELTVSYLDDEDAVESKWGAMR